MIRRYRDTIMYSFLKYYDYITHKILYYENKRKNYLAFKRNVGLYIIIIHNTQASDCVKRL